MIRADLQKILTKLFVLGVLSIGLWFFSGSASTQIPTPKISAEPQQESPLLISATYMTASDAFKPQYSYTITNVSGKTIRAYAIKESVIFGNGQARSTGVVLTHLPSLSQLLHPNQSFPINNNDNSKYTKPVDEIILSVDFVEFSDGSTWGNDSFNSAQRLAGQRAGGKAALKKFREKVKIGGSETLTDRIIQNEAIQIDNQVFSKDWQEGFQAGVGIVRNRLKKAKNNGGAEVAKELERPFDASDGRQER